jgi:hypothetical protein
MLYQLSYSRETTESFPQPASGHLHGSGGTVPAGADREPPVGIEPTTARLRIECSTPELRWHPGRSISTSGAEGSRTPDLCSAIAALSQLSYGPVPSNPPEADPTWKLARRPVIGPTKCKRAAGVRITELRPRTFQPLRGQCDLEARSPVRHRLIEAQERRRRAAKWAVQDSNL